MEHRDDGAEVVDLDVFYGEKYEFQVGLANVGNITVEELELRYAVQEAYAKRCVLFPSRYSSARLLIAVFDWQKLCE